VESRAASLSLALIMLVLPASRLAAQQSAQELQLDPASSRIFVVTHRSGILSFLGHEHALLAPRWSARLCWAAPAHAASRAEVIIDARALEIDADSVRRMAGLGQGPSPDQRAQIQRKLHEPANLDSERFPELRFRSSSVRTAGDTLLVVGALTIRDRTRPVEWPVLVRRHGVDGYWLAGMIRIRQTDFGIRPESIGGVVKVADVVDIHIGLLATPTTRAC
jgi:polyisoprenoid-binding protein YceI